MAGFRTGAGGATNTGGELGLTTAEINGLITTALADYSTDAERTAAITAAINALPPDATLNAAQVKARYESNADTNVFDNAARDKLAGLESVAIFRSELSAAAATITHDLSLVNGGHVRITLTADTTGAAGNDYSVRFSSGDATTTSYEDGGNRFNVIFDSNTTPASDIIQILNTFTGVTAAGVVGDGGSLTDFLAPGNDALVIQLAGGANEGDLGPHNPTKGDFYTARDGYLVNVPSPLGKPFGVETGYALDLATDTRTDFDNTLVVPSNRTWLEFNFGDDVPPAGATIRSRLAEWHKLLIADFLALPATTAGSDVTNSLRSSLQFQNIRHGGTDMYISRAANNTILIAANHDTRGDSYNMRIRIT